MLAEKGPPRCHWNSLTQARSTIAKDVGFAFSQNTVGEPSHAWFHRGDAEKSSAPSAMNPSDFVTTASLTGVRERVGCLQFFGGAADRGSQFFTHQHLLEFGKVDELR